MNEAPIRVAILNDYEIVVEGLRSMLAPYRDRIHVVTANAEDVIPEPVDITLYDTFSQPQVDNADIEDVISDARSGAVVIYTWNLHPRLAGQAIEKGCSGFLDKALQGTDLVAHLEKISQGQIIVSPVKKLRGTEEAPRVGAWPGKRRGLTPREAEIVALITQGLSNDEIAKHAFISINSVKSFIRSAYRKIGVTRRSQAVRWGFENQMLPTKWDGPEDAEQLTAS